MGMSKAERKALKAKQNNKAIEELVIEDRNLGYDADFYVNNNNEEIECVRVDFIKKPDWYNDMFINGDIHYLNNELQAKCSDGNWYKGKDIKSYLVKYKDNTIKLFNEEELKNNWKLIATSNSIRPH